MSASDRGRPRESLMWWAAVAALPVAYLIARGVVDQPGLGVPLRVAAALLPVPAFVLFLRGIGRTVRDLDELEQRIQLEALAIAYPLAMMLLMALGLLQRVIVLPPEDWSYRHVWAFLPLFYFLGLAIARRRYQ